MLLEVAPSGAGPVGLAEIKAYLRIEGAQEDALLAALLRAATGVCEAFTGRTLMARDFTELVAADGCWRRLSASPVAAVTQVEALAKDGAVSVLSAEAWDAEIDADGVARVRAAGTSEQLRARVGYRAGLASDWNAIPEPLRQGIVRLVAHLHAHRDAAEAGGPPAAVAALWRPWRRLRLI